jgi:hypothetical protein
MIENLSVLEAAKRSPEAAAMLFFWCLDNFRYDEMQELVTDDFWWQRPTGPMIGKAVLKKFTDERSSDRHTRHVLTNPIRFGDEGDIAKVSFVMTAYLNQLREGASLPMPLPPPGALADYVFDILKTKDGWRVKRIANKVMFRAAS